MSLTGPLKKGTNHMANGTADYEPQRTNNYEVQILGLEGITDMFGNVVNQASRAGEIITLCCNSFTAPDITMSDLRVRYGNNSRKYAGVPDITDATLELNDYIGVNTENILKAWFSKVYNPITEDIGYEIEYKKTGYLIEYDTKYSTSSTIYNYQSRIWKLEGLWPANLQIGQFSAENNAIRRISVTLKCDAAKPQY